MLLLYKVMSEFLPAGRICEPEYFPDINTEETLHNFTTCLTFKTSPNIYFPSVDKKESTCTLQKEPLLFSCVGAMDGLGRLCPCRDFKQGQSALCANCDR